MIKELPLDENNQNKVKENPLDENNQNKVKENPLDENNQNKVKENISKLWKLRFFQTIVLSY
jgi:hypothetical protein